MLASCVAVLQLIASGQALAVGGGITFEADDGDVVVKADSMDFTYHACTDIVGQNNKRFREAGYFWISSFQDETGVVDSQINYISLGGYHIYGNYFYQAGQVGQAQSTISGNRLSYRVLGQNISIQLFLDPLKDTELSIQGCQVAITGDADDVLLGRSNSLFQGEKSETDGLANGDFKLVFNNWVWDQGGVNLINAIDPFTLDDFNFFIFNGNITNLGGALAVDHLPEGSGNLFWLDTFGD